MQKPAGMRRPKGVHTPSYRDVLFLGLCFYSLAVPYFRYIVSILTGLNRTNKQCPSSVVLLCVMSVPRSLSQLLQHCALARDLAYTAAGRACSPIKNMLRELRSGGIATSG